MKHLGVLVSVFLVWSGLTVVSQASDGPRCFGREPTIWGSPDEETVVGTWNDDVIKTVEGNLTVEALEGDDIVCSSPGVERISGDSGNDLLFGDNSSDQLLGGSGDDWLLGAVGDDALFGGPGRDVLVGDDEPLGSNVATFEPEGRDAGYLSDGSDSVDGGPGLDRVRYSSAVDVDLTLDVARGGAEDSLTAVEGAVSAGRVLGDDGANYLVGSDAQGLRGDDDVWGHDARGGRGDDTITMTGSEGTAWGGPGDDVLFPYFAFRYKSVYDSSRGEEVECPGPREGLFDGGRGADTITFDDSMCIGQIEADLADRTVVVQLAEYYTSYASFTVSRIESLVGTRGYDEILGSDRDDTLSGRSGDDRIDGRGGLDVADGGEGSDRCKAEVTTNCE